MHRTTFIALCLIAGCSATPDYDARVGDAVRQARLAQVINPNAGSNPDQVAGIDGQAALEAQKRYHDSFREPPPVVNVINIGGTPSTPPPNR
jgi:hypothetical protein